jgi:beta-glucosidase
LYLRDVVARVARPLKLLTGFARVSLEPGQAVDVTFHVHADRTAYTGPDLRRIVEPGEFEVMMGTSSLDLPCRTSVRITGDVRVVGHDRVLTTPVTIAEGAGGG